MTEHTPERKLAWRVEWSDALSVGIDAIDAEHRHFIGLINAFNAALRTRASKQTLRDLLGDIALDAQQHFAHEEHLFLQHHYPDMQSHGLEHARLLGVIDQLLQQFEKSELEPTWIEIGMTLRDALVSHLFEYDMHYVGKLGD